MSSTNRSGGIIALNKVREMLDDAKSQDRQAASKWSESMDEYDLDYLEDALTFNEGYICALKDVLIELEGVVQTQ